MSETRYDIVFAGDLASGADPQAARARIQGLFNLPDDTLEKLFSGRPLAIKRGVDEATAARYREVFRDAGALLVTVPAATEDTAPGAGEPAEAGDSGKLRLAPMDDKPLETPPVHRPLIIDIGYLSLVQGENWTLADCTPPEPPARIPDIGHLTLVEPEPVDRREPLED
jgi:hypothetical protein